MGKMLDSKGIMARAKARMPVDCSVRKSQYCDEILSLRLQGFSYRKIEEWLREKGRQFAIPAATLCRNLVRGFGDKQDFVPVYEQMTEEHGGDMLMDAGRVVAGQLLVQRTRLDYMVRMEAERRKQRPGYSNPRIRQEMETLLMLARAAEDMKALQEKGSLADGKVMAEISEGAKEALANMILEGQVSIPGVKGTKLKLVGES